MLHAEPMNQVKTKVFCLKQGSKMPLTGKGLNESAAHPGRTPIRKGRGCSSSSLGVKISDFGLT